MSDENTAGVMHAVCETLLAEIPGCGFLLLVVPGLLPAREAGQAEANATGNATTVCSNAELSSNLSPGEMIALIDTGLEPLVAVFRARRGMRQ